MCGITGAIAFTDRGEKRLRHIEEATACLAKRGPDSEGIYYDNFIALGHRRLAIIDVSNEGNQPFMDDSGRYTIVFNGEFFNYREHKTHLLAKGVKFRSDSDTEVLLQLYMLEGEAFLHRINGFFALCIYDKHERSVLLVRDRMGVKPLIYYFDEDNLLFASELKSLMAFNIPKAIDQTSLYQYLVFNYIPGPYSIYKNVNKLKPGHFIKFKIGQNVPVTEKKYYEIKDQPQLALTYEKAQHQLYDHLQQAVERRLISDVPLGAFLSGGIDSSVIVALASKYVKQLNTFSIGYKNEPFYDETHYAELVAGMHGTNHTVFKLSNDELFEHLAGILDYMDEPFADSSAIAVYILSNYTRKAVTVALSGDGADEMFGGYNKHRAEWLVRNRPLLNLLLKTVAHALPKEKGSRNNTFQNKIRQIHRFAEGLKLNHKERYLRWCSIANEAEVGRLISMLSPEEYHHRKEDLGRFIRQNRSMNDVFLNDMHLVLPGDMLTKVDLMSMANSLEIRNPFLDYTVVDFAFSLPENFKIDKQHQKRIVKDAFRKELPQEIYYRSKKGFEVPLLKWFQTELKSKINDLWLEENFIKEQGIFNFNEIALLKHQLFSGTGNEIQARIWGLIVFQNWWLKHHQN